jgi:hypothetical protein
MKQGGYIVCVLCLTKQEQRVLGIVVVLLLTGWATKIYRAAHPPLKPGGVTAKVAIQQAKP